MILSHPLVEIAFSLVAGIIFLAVAIQRHRRLDISHAGSLFIALGSGFTVPKGLALCWYIIDPDPITVDTKLRGFEREIFVAGALMVFIALASLWSLCERERQVPTDHSA
jgi:hypothetical protein